MGEDELLLLLLLLPLCLWEGGREGGRILVIKGAQRQEAEAGGGECLWFIYSVYRILNAPQLRWAQSAEPSLNERCTNRMSHGRD